MTGNYTLMMVKPDAVRNGNAEAIFQEIKKHGFEIVAQKKLQLSRAEAEAFYVVHKERPFYGELVDFMISGPIFAAVLKKENAVPEWRTLMGKTDPAECDEGTIRKMFATSKAENAVHGSDSNDNALNEIFFFFSSREIIAQSGIVQLNDIIGRQPE